MINSKSWRMTFHYAAPARLASPVPQGVFRQAHLPRNRPGARDCVPQHLPTSSPVHPPESSLPTQAAAGRRPALRHGVQMRPVPIQSHPSIGVLPVAPASRIGLPLVQPLPRERKFFSISRPCSERMLSGWNCTPQIGSSLWRTPMISPSSVSAVISRQSGSVSRLMTSEW